MSLANNGSTIGSPLHMHLEDSLLSVSGWISFSDDIDHWVKNRVPIEFQNLALAWIITGHDYVLDGHGSGGIYGNGQVWYDWAKDEGNKYGRPMSFAIINSTDVIVQSESSILVLRSYGDSGTWTYVSRLTDRLVRCPAAVLGFYRRYQQERPIQELLCQRYQLQPAWGRGPYRPQLRSEHRWSGYLAIS